MLANEDDVKQKQPSLILFRSVSPMSQHDRAGAISPGARRHALERVFPLLFLVNTMTPFFAPHLLLCWVSVLVQLFEVIEVASASQGGINTTDRLGTVNTIFRF